MNEKIKILIPYVIAFIIGGLIFGGSGGYWIHNRANKRITDLKEQNDKLGRTNQEIRDSNTKLTEAARRDAEIKQQLSDTIEQQQRDLSKAREDLAGAIDANKSAGKYNKEAIEYIDWIIERYGDNGGEQEVLEGK